VKLVMEKTETGARWVVQQSEAERHSRENLEPGSEEVPTLRTSRRMGQPGEIRNAHFSEDQGEIRRQVAANTRYLDGAEPSAGANDSAALEMTSLVGNLGMTEYGEGNVIPWLCAAVDPNEKWWERLRGNPKRAGEISQAAFLLKAEMLGFDLALPWGDNQKFDFVVWRRDGRAMRVQVKGTGRLHRRGYEVQPVHATRRGGKKRYTKKDIDVIAAHVQPVDAWYLIPIEKVGRAKSLRLYPGIEVRAAVRIPTLRKARRVGQPAQEVARWEKWRDAWEVLGER